MDIDDLIFGDYTPQPEVTRLGNNKITDSAVNMTALSENKRERETET